MTDVTFSFLHPFILCNLCLPANQSINQPASMAYKREKLKSTIITSAFKAKSSSVVRPAGLWNSKKIIK